MNRNTSESILTLVKENQSSSYNFGCCLQFYSENVRKYEEIG